MCYRKRFGWCFPLLLLAPMLVTALLAPDWRTAQSAQDLPAVRAPDPPARPVSTLEPASGRVFPLFVPAQVATPTATACCTPGQVGVLSVGFDGGSASIPDWVPSINGPYGAKFSADGSRERDEQCTLTWSGSGNLEVKAGRLVQVTGSLSGSFQWTNDPETCEDSFAGGCISGNVGTNVSYPVYDFRVDRIGRVTIRITGSLSGNGEACWLTTDPTGGAWPDEYSGTVTISIGGQGEFRFYRWRRIRITVSGDGSVTFEFSNQSTDVTWCLTARGSGSFWVVELSFEKSWCSGSQYLIVRDQGVTVIELQPAQGPVETISYQVIVHPGSAAVYGPNSLLPDVSTDLIYDELPSLALRPGGDDGVVVWAHGATDQGTSTGQAIHSAFWDGTDWSAPVIIQPDEGRWRTAPAVAYVGGVPMAVWARVATIVPPTAVPDDFFAALTGLDLLWSTWNGTTWSAPQPITTDGAMDANPALASFGNTALVVWERDGDGDSLTQGDVDLHYAVWDGSNWSAPAAFTNDSLADSSSALAFDPTGKAMLVWLRDTDGDEDTLDDVQVHYAIYDGGNWTAPAPVVATAFGHDSPAVAFDSSGRALAAWSALGQIDYAVYSNGSWSSQGRVSLGVSGTNVEPIVVTGPGGEVAVIWQNFSSGDKELVARVGSVSNPDVAWECGPEFLTDDALEDWQHTGAIDAQGRLNLVWLEHSPAYPDDDDLYAFSAPLAGIGSNVLDFDGNGQTDIADVMWLAGQWHNPAEAPADLDGDLRVTAADIQIVAAHWGLVCPACQLPEDVYRDGQVTVQDAMATTFGWRTARGDALFDGRADQDGDDDVDVVDVQLVTEAWGEACP